MHHTQTDGTVEVLYVQSGSFLEDIRDGEGSTGVHCAPKAPRMCKRFGIATRAVLRTRREQTHCQNDAGGDRRLRD